MIFNIRPSFGVGVFLSDAKIEDEKRGAAASNNLKLAPFLGLQDTGK